ncbi:MAG: hypothetical protein IPM98_12715 [Lewinellaceae bacterium]|nr:hypothetical protein [Lewinellaceae bacterium]
MLIFATIYHVNILYHLMSLYCYICGQPASSAEHAPAKCFFPKDNRSGILTTVGSCSTHNEETSKDDEYVRNIIAMTIGNNPVAHSVFLNNCIKSFNRSPKLLSATTKIRKRVFTQEKGKDELSSTYAFQIDRERVDLVMRKIAYATFFKKYNARWNRELAIGTEFLRNGTMEADEYGMLIQSAKKQLYIPSYEGTNHEIFKFAFLETESRDINEQILIMIFYEGFEVWAFAQPNTIGPKL